MNVQMNEWMADADRQYKKKRRTDMQETWLEQFYNEMDAEKRLDILNTNADKTVNARSGCGVYKETLGGALRKAQTEDRCIRRVSDAAQIHCGERGK